MSNQKPGLGRIVLYTTTAPERTKMSMGNRNSINVRPVLPAIIVGLPDTPNGDACNLKVLMDGYGELWVTDCARGDGPGQWNWPQITIHTDKVNVVKAEDPVAIKRTDELPVKVEVTNPTQAAKVVANPSVEEKPASWVKPKGSWGD